MVPVKELIGPALIAVAVAGALLYNGHQDRLQRQCLTALSKVDNFGTPPPPFKWYATLYDIDTESGFCRGWWPASNVFK